MTYEQIITRFQWWADAHPMIRSFTHGNLELADLDKEKDFPAVHVQPLAFPINVHTLTYRFEVYVFELHREDSGEAREIKVDLSDTLQIFGDLVAEIRNGFEAFDREDFLLQYPIEPTPFIQEFNGVYTGVQGSLAIETAFLANACESPVNVADPPSQLCPVGTVTLNGVTFGTVASGGTLAGLVQYVNGTSVGSLVGGIWTIPNPSSCDPALITVNGDSPALSVASGATQNITVRNSAATAIGTRSGAAVTIGDMTLDKADGTTSAIVIVPGGTVALVPNWTIEGTFSSPQSVTVPSWDAPYEVATQTITGGGTITDITVNAGSIGSTFVGADLDGADAVAITFTGTITKIVLTFV